MNDVVRAATLAVLCAGFWACGGTYRPGDVEDAVGGAQPPPAGPPVAERGRWAMSDGVELYYQTRGLGRNVLVIHGGPGYPSAGTWPAADALGDRYRFVYYHQRGSGLSDRPVDRFESRRWTENRDLLTSALGVGRQLADIETVRRILGDEALLIVGHSYGAFLAALYAAEFLNRVERLILIAPAQVLFMPVDGGGLFGEIEARLPEDRLAAYREWMEELFDYRSIWSRSEAELVALSNGIMPFFETALRSYLAEVAEDRPVWGWSATNAAELTGGWIQHGIYLSLGRRYDMRPFLSRITAETTIFVGDTDFSGGPAAIGDYLDAIPGARMTVLRNAGHFPQGDAGRFADYLQRALDGTL